MKTDINKILKKGAKVRVIDYSSPKKLKELKTLKNNIENSRYGKRGVIIK